MNIPEGLPCRIWGGRIAPNGYGTRGRKYAHRIALEAALGRPVTPGMDACHTCDVRSCIEPTHLYEGTRKQNMADCTERQRHNKPSGERHWRSKVTDAQVAQMRLLTDDGWSRKSIADAYGLNPATVSRIVRNIWRQEVAA